MAFRPVLWRDQVVGFEERSDHALFFFGTELGTSEALAAVYPELNFHRLKQVHGDTLVEVALSTNVTCEADAQWTKQLSSAPVVLTADCVPVLIGHPEFVCSIHAGWRGVANEITIKTLKTLRQRGFDLNAATIAIGPHIGPGSFEVDRQLGEQLARQHRAIDPHHEVLTPAVNAAQKVYIDLRLMVRAQIRSLGVLDSQVVEFYCDTKTDLRFASFRRQKENTRRNFSFASRLSR